MPYWNFPRYVTVAEKRARAEKKLRQLKKKNPDIDPVIIKGRSLATTWWGKAWNTNLERYADFANRIGRGRSYARHRAVLDLRLEPGTVSALVHGSASKPYTVRIEIDPLKPKRWRKIIDECRGTLDSLPDLLAGRFPKALSHLFLEKGSGLFPSPREIRFDCSCPDWAAMCKHVAATLYGVGARLDRDPALFFQLRRVDMDDLIDTTLTTATDDLLQRADRNTHDVIAENDLGDLFGIDMDEMPDWETPTPADPPKHETKLSSARGIVSSSAKASKGRKKKPAGDEKQRILERVAQAADGIDAPALHEATGIGLVKIRNVLYQAYRKNQIRKIARGVYGGLPARRRSPQERADAVVAVVCDASDGVRAPQIAEAAGIALAAVRPLLSRLTKARRIRRIAHGSYGPPRPTQPLKGATGKILDRIAAHPDGVTVSTLQDLSGYPAQKVRNIVFRLHRTGRIRRVGRGIYALK